MSNNHLKKMEFDALFKFIIKFPWLLKDEKRIDALSHLLFNECSSEEQVKLIKDLLEKFIHLEFATYRSHVSEICKRIMEKYEENKTQIVAATADSNADSGQALLYALKHDLHDWENHLLVNRYDQSLKEFLRKGCIHTNIIIVDDFIGSGQTMVNRIKTIINQYGSKNYSPNIEVKVVAATIVGINHIQSIFPQVAVFSCIQLQKGLDDSYDSQELPIMASAMNNLEDKLLQSYKDRPLPKFGYANAQALFSIEDVNTPNSVFPVFWWKYSSENKTRPVLFKRAMKDA